MAVTLTAALTASAGWGYLPIAGPAPLRFQAPPRPKSTLKPLPPLEVKQPAGPGDADSAEQSPGDVGSSVPAASSGADANAAAPAIPEAPADSTASGAGAGAEGTVSQDGLLTPQMLVKYFLSGPTNAPANSVFIPLGFRPPQPGTPPSSQATYSTSP